jgi:hypothetical protein
MDVFIFSLVLIAIIEAVISGRWNPTYFRVGIPVYSKTLLFEDASPESLEAEALNDAFRRSLTPSLVFKKIGVGEFAFREKLFQFVLLTYTPIMHGRLQISPTSREVRVIGLLNWWILAFVLAFFVFFPHDLDFLPFLFVVLAVIYLFQKSKYDKVGRFASQCCSFTPSGIESG